MQRVWMVALPGMVVADRGRGWDRRGRAEDWIRRFLGVHRRQLARLSGRERHLVRPGLQTTHRADDFHRAG